MNTIRTLARGVRRFRRKLRAVRPLVAAAFPLHTAAARPWSRPAVTGIAYEPISLGYSCEVKYQLSRALYERKFPDGDYDISSHEVSHIVEGASRGVHPPGDHPRGPPRMRRSA